MTVLKDPDGAEIAALLDMANLTDQRVLEIGCGDGRLTWRYAQVAALVTAIDPDAEGIAAAEADYPRSLRGKVDFQVSSLQEYASNQPGRAFDLALLSWSL